MKEITMKGRTVPPQPERKRTISEEELTEMIMQQKGVWLTEYRHSDGCPTQFNQRIEDCICRPLVTIRKVG